MTPPPVKDSKVITPSSQFWGRAKCVDVGQSEGQVRVRDRLG